MSYYNKHANKLTHKHSFIPVKYYLVTEYSKLIKQSFSLLTEYLSLH